MPVRRSDMIAPASAIAIEGSGPEVLLIHGTGVDRDSWRELTAHVGGRVRTIAYDRRGNASWPDFPALLPRLSDLANDAASVVETVCCPPVHLCAVSFGAVIALEMMRTRPALVKSAVLFEPAVSGRDDVPSVPTGILEEFERQIDSGVPEQAGEFFCRLMLGETAWNLLPQSFRTAARQRWRQIHRDLHAGADHLLNYADLKALVTPTLLLRGGRSRTTFEPGVKALHNSLQNSSRQYLSSAEHVLRGEAWLQFARALITFVEHHS